MEQIILPVPIKFDTQLGKSAAPDVEAQYGGLDPDPRVQTYINSIGTKMAKDTHHPELPYTFNVLNSNIINAFALPGGPVYICKGALGILNTESQLASVLGHELAHINRRDSMNQLQLALGSQIALLGLESLIKRRKGERLDPEHLTPFTKILTGLSELNKLGYSRRDEYDADKEGLRYTHKAGYNPLGMVEFFQKLDALSPGMNKFEEWTSTHPLLVKRIGECEKTIKKEFPDSYKRREEEKEQEKKAYEPARVKWEWQKYIPYLIAFGLTTSIYRLIKGR